MKWISRIVAVLVAVLVLAGIFVLWVLPVRLTTGESMFILFILPHF